MHENTLLTVFNSSVDRLDKKIDILKEENPKIKKELTDLRKNVQYHSDNVDEAKGHCFFNIFLYFYFLSSL